MLDAIIEGLHRWRDRRVVVAMSGGVDSSLVAAALHRAGAEVIGVHMRQWRYDSSDRPTHEDAPHVRAVADALGIDFHVIDVEEEFRRRVIDPFVADYLAGLTPNPCVLCNRDLKLGALLARARAWGADRVATGHYGRVEHDASSRRHTLLRAADETKDQSYYLFALEQEQLAGLLMPLGGMLKSDTRAMARRLGLAVHDKPDSVEVCFIPDNDYRRFVRREARLDPEATAGEVVDLEGRVLGRHGGIHNFTIGQRRGIGIAAPRPLYVVAIDPARRRVIVGEAGALRADSIRVDRLHWVALTPGSRPFRARVRIRYRGAALPALVIPDGDGGGALVRFERPARAPAPGQAAVAYDPERGERVLAGGWIAARSNGGPINGAGGSGTRQGRSGGRGRCAGGG